MSLSGTHTFVGFGLGAIQSGLFLNEAFQSGNFRRLVAAEIMPEVVSSIRASKGHISINVAHQDHLETDQIDSIEIENPTVTLDRQRLIDAVAEAEEIATAVPSVDFYFSDSQASLHHILAAGLCKKIEIGGPRAVVYTAENHNQAAEILEKMVTAEIPPELRPEIRKRVQFLNTVIGKMSQIVINPDEIAARGLTTITPDISRSFLVESFNEIFISKIQFSKPFYRGISVFNEKDQLFPFEEAKLYGHNAIHALAGFLGKFAGIRLIADLRELPGMIAFLHSAFVEESGHSLISKYGDIDPLFTPQGYDRYAKDLIARMTNPFLMDSVERVTRDTSRKLGWDDRLVGTMRLALTQGIKPTHFALGAAAALATMDPLVFENERSIELILNSFWANFHTNYDEKSIVIALIKDAMPKLKGWQNSGYTNIKILHDNYQ